MERVLSHRKSKQTETMEMANAKVAKVRGVLMETVVWGFWDGTSGLGFDSFDNIARNP